MGATSARMPLSQPAACGFGGDVEEVDEIGGVGGVGRAVGVAHQLAVAVVGRDEELAAEGERLFHDLAHAVVDRFHGFDAGLDHAGVADHVGIGEVQDDEVVRGQQLDDFAR